MSKTDKRSLGALLLHGGDWRGIRVMGLGERLVVIGVSAVTTLLCLYAARYFLSRSDAVEDASALRVHTEILTQPESVRQRQADNSN